MKRLSIDAYLRALQVESGTWPFRLPLYVYAADGLLVDAGSRNTLQAVQSFAMDEKIHAAALTHVHEDHVGAAFWLNERNIPVYLPGADIPEAAIKTRLPLYRRITWGNRQPFTALPLGERIETEYCTLDVLHAPGHHPHHVAYYEKKRGWLFTGDIYVSRRQQVAFKDENIADAIETLTLLCELDFDILLCGHSGVHYDGRERLRSKLQFFTDMQGKVRTLREKGLDYHEIDTMLFPKKGLWTWVSRGEWSSLNIVSTILPE